MSLYLGPGVYVSGSTVYRVFSVHRVLNGTVCSAILSEHIRMRMSHLTVKQLFAVPLSYMRCRDRGELFVTFRRTALRTTRRPKAFRGRGHRTEENSP
jgi:hypothetical protein